MGRNMNTTFQEPSNTAATIEVEIYETGEKILITDNGRLTSEKNMGRPIIITAAEHKKYKTQPGHHDM